MLDLFVDIFGDLGGLLATDGRFDSFGGLLANIIAGPFILIALLPVIIALMAILTIFPLDLIFNKIPLAFMFKKAGIPVWHIWVPILCGLSRSKMVYGNNGDYFRLYIPFVQIYYFFKLHYDMAMIFGRSKVYAVFCGLFCPILNYGMVSRKRQYRGCTELDRYW